MNFLFAFITVCFLLLAPLVGWAAPAGMQSRAWVVIDHASGQTLAAHQAELPLAPASLTQLMTAYVLFSDIRAGRLSLAGMVNVPKAATEMDGVRLFLKADEPASVDTLIQAMLVSSATDAVMTLVLAVDRDENAFVARMNETAKRLGLTRTRFMNATGLTEPGHESTARDLALLARALIRDFPERMEGFATREITYNGLTHYNGNRLLWRDSTVDGLKVGRTQQAGFCIAASSQRGSQRRIAVVLGARNDAQRTQEALKLLNYAFEAYDSVRLYTARQTVKTLDIYRGARGTLALGFQHDLHVVVPRGAQSRVTAEVITQQPLLAPVRRGERHGTLRLTLEDKPIGDYPLVALHDVAVAGILGRAWDTLRLLFKR